MHRFTTGYLFKVKKKLLVHQEPSHQKVASIWAYMCSILRVHSNHSLCPSITKFTDLICSVHQEPSRQKVASICAYMFSIHCNLTQLPSSNPMHIITRPYIFITPRTKPSNSGFHLSLYVPNT